jgi:hypothetical protein
MNFSHLLASNQKFTFNSTPSKVTNDHIECFITSNTSRRQFLKTGATWMAILTTAPWLMKPNSAYGNAEAFSMDAKIVKVAFKTDKELVREMVPHPLKANDEGLLYAFIGHFNSSYNQAALEIPVSCFIPELDNKRDVKGSYFKVWYDNQYSSVSYGSRIYGYPKQLADVTYTESQGLIEGAVNHKGKQVARIKFFLPGKKETPLSFDQYEPHFNFKSIKGSRRLAIIRWANYKEHERKSGEVEIEPFGIEVKKVIGANYKIIEWEIPWEPTVFMEHVLK